MAKLRQNVPLSYVCDRYLVRIESQGQAVTSVRTARYALSRLQKAVATTRNPDPMLHLITPQAMDEFCFGPNGISRNVSARFFNRYRSIYKLMFAYAVDMGWTDVNPMQSIGRARPDPEKPRLLLTAGELLTLPDLCATPVQRVAVAVGSNTGLRSNDIINLRVHDVSLSAGLIHTDIRKTRKADAKPITASLHRELGRWLDTYASLMNVARHDLEDDWYLIPSYSIEPPAPGASNGTERRIRLRPTTRITNPHRLVQNPLSKLGYPVKGEGFHTLRRSSARILFELLREKGESRDHALMIVQAYLNHSDVKMTQHYLGLSHERDIRDKVLRDQDFLSKVAEQEQARITGERVRELHGGASASHKAV